MTGIQLIAKERKRQTKEEGFGKRHDDSHVNGELAHAAACYATPPDNRKTWFSGKLISPWWPWEENWWRPTPKDRVRELVKAGALIAAEIDRLQRLPTNRTGGAV